MITTNLPFILIGKTLLFLTGNQYACSDLSSYSFISFIIRQRINNPNPLISKNQTHHYVDLVCEIVESVGKEVKKIVLVDDKSRSLTWFAISFIVWTFAAHISSRTLVVLGLLSAFTIPRFYRSNKHVVDARIAQTNSMLTGHIQKAQTLAAQSANDAYAKARTYAARTGTTGTDAKNTLNRASVVTKED